MRFLTIVLLLFCTAINAQTRLSGNLKDTNNLEVAYATVFLFQMPDSTFYKGTVTDSNGRFDFENIARGEYTLAVNSIGFTPLTQKLTINNTPVSIDLEITEALETLDGITITARKPVIEKRPDRLIFTVENSALSTTNAANILKNTPGVFEMNGSYMVQNAPAVIYVNDKRVYLTDDELNALLTGYSGDNVKNIEVITNPSANYDAEGVAVININTIKQVSLGYKGSINGSYTIDEFAKYQIGTSQFYKNDWVNIYANYNYNPRKDLKLDTGQIGFFNPDGTRSSRWFTDFEKVTESDAHNINTAIDFTLDSQNEINISANYNNNNNQEVDTRVQTLILPSGATSFDGFDTNTLLDVDREAGFVNAGWANSFNEGQGSLNVEGNYIFTDRHRMQDLFSSFFNSNGDQINTNSFFTIADQNIDIYVAKADYENLIGSYLLKAGGKFSDVSSQSSLDFFETNSGNSVFNPTLSDRFDYDEKIYAAYVQIDREWDKWALAAGLRAEQTDVTGNSRVLGQVNTQEYLELFPNISITNQYSESNSLTLSYNRSIDRPRYESLNPFSYFINDNNVNTGNPNLQPSFTNKINLNWNLKYQYFFDLYYTRTDNALAVLPFQNNQTNVLNAQNVNMNYEMQYSLDFATVQYLNEDIFAQFQTSLFYMENEFEAVQSGGVLQKNDVTGFFFRMMSRINLSADRTFSVDISGSYLSNILSGSYEFKNQLTSSIGFYKSIWDGRGILTLNYNDIFLSQNQPLRSRYLNQDNEYLAAPETNTIELGFVYKFGNFRLKNNDVTTPDDEKRIETRENGFFP